MSPRVFSLWSINTYCISDYLSPILLMLLERLEFFASILQMKQNLPTKLDNFQRCIVFHKLAYGIIVFIVCYIYSMCVYFGLWRALGSVEKFDFQIIHFPSTPGCWKNYRIYTTSLIRSVSTSSLRMFPYHIMHFLFLLYIHYYGTFNFSSLLE